MFVFCKRCGSQAWAMCGPFDDRYECPKCGPIDADGNQLEELYRLTVKIKNIPKDQIPHVKRAITRNMKKRNFSPVEYDTTLMELICKCGEDLKPGSFAFSEDGHGFMEFYCPKCYSKKEYRWGPQK